MIVENEIREIILDFNMIIVDYFDVVIIIIFFY